DEPLALHAVEHGVFRVAEALDDEADFAAEGVALQVADLGQVELVNQFRVDDPLEVLKALEGLLPLLLAGHGAAGAAVVAAALAVIVADHSAGEARHDCFFRREW